MDTISPKQLQLKRYSSIYKWLYFTIYYVHGALQLLHYHCASRFDKELGRFYERKNCIVNTKLHSF